jgi:hypothetical protein
MLIVAGAALLIAVSGYLVHDQVARDVHRLSLP